MGLFYRGSQMQDNQKQIHDWQEKVKQQYGDESRLFQYLFETMDNFYYRYLETTESKDLKTQELADHVWGARSFESNMGEAFKISNKEIKAGITDLAKRIPRDQKPAVRYSLQAMVKELKAEHGHLVLTSEIHWDFPEYQDSSRKISKSVTFRYEDLAVFRKELALKLEDVCTLFT
jgi:hypothetical protein